MIRNIDIIEKLLACREAKKQHKIIVADLNTIAFEIGLPQSMLGKVSVYDFLDGYLVGQGIIRNFEDTKNESI